MKTTKLSGIAVALTSVCVITSTTFANAQSIKKVTTSSACASKILNRGAVSNKPQKAVAKAYTLWNNLSKEKGYKNFKAAKNPQVVLTSLPLYKSSGKSAWKANVLAFPCKSIS